MAENTGISWATHTWNPWVGCDKVSPACDSCYAEAWAKRAGTPGLWAGDRRRTKTWGDPLRYNKAALAAGRRDSIFACSLADWFDNHPDVAPIRAEAWMVVRACQAVDWYLVTKRIPNVMKMLPPDWSQENYGHVVIIITVVNQAEADRDIPRLMALKMKFPWLRIGLSIEPMLGPIDLDNIRPDATMTISALTGKASHLLGMKDRAHPLDWVIVGGESGGKARPIHPAWVRAIRDQCAAAGVPFHFKQFGEWLAWDDAINLEGVKLHKVETCGFGASDPYGNPQMARVGVEKAGRTLQGRTHDAGPRAVAA